MAETPRIGIGATPVGPRPPAPAPLPSGAELLSRFALVTDDHDGDEDAHDHAQGQACTCHLRGR